MFDYDFFIKIRFAISIRALFISSSAKSICELNKKFFRNKHRSLIHLIFFIRLWSFTKICGIIRLKCVSTAPGKSPPLFTPVFNSDVEKMEKISIQLEQTFFYPALQIY